MLNHSKAIKSKLFLIGGVFLGISALVFPIFQGHLILVDPFHYGEFFAATTGLFPDSNIPFYPLTIHGALDFIPGILAENYWGANHYFLPTFGIYKFLSFFASVFLVLNAYELTRGKAHQGLLLIAVSAVAPLFVGYRDVVLLISLYIFFKLIDVKARRDLEIIKQITFGSIVAFGIFWSFDRGIAGAVSFGSAVLVLLVRSRLYFFSILSFFSVIVSLGLIFEIFSFENYFRNLFFLIKTSSQWSYGWRKGPVFLTLLAIVLNLAVIYILVRESSKAKLLTERFPIVLCFALLSLFMLKMGINRADIQHIYFSCWIPVLVLFFLYEKEFTIREIDIFLYGILICTVILMILFKSSGLAMVAGIFLLTVFRPKGEFLKKFTIRSFVFLIVVCLGFPVYVSVKAFSGGHYNWVKSFYTPVSNRLSATDGVVWASDRLQAQSVQCVFDMSNNGVINGLIRRPSCSRFTYPIYANSEYESILISDLRSASPKAIVYSSTYWSYSIDGKDMRVRFPDLDKFILKNYPKEDCNHGYCVRYKEI
jgi:hypothetical protein